MSGGYGDVDDDGATEVVCPHCSASIDAFEVFTHNHGKATPNCPSCGEEVEDDAWIQE